MNPFALLSLLGGVINAVRPDAPAPPANPIEGSTFAELLDQAKSGEISSDLDITVAADAGVELTEDQLARLAVAADQAQAAGASRAVVLIDGMALSFDVQSRRVTGTVPINEAGVYSGFDAIINAGDETKQAAAGTLPLPGQRATPGNESLLGLLAAQHQSRDLQQQLQQSA